MNNEITVRCELRKVMVHEKKFDRDKKQMCDICYEAKFHRFAQDTDEGAEQCVYFPVAILELNDGKVVTVPATWVQFIKEDNEVE